MKPTKYLISLVTILCFSFSANAQNIKYLNTAHPVPYIPVIAGVNFGFSIEANDSIAVIGAPFYRVNATRSGAAFVFRHSGTSWSRVATLIASDTTAQANLGYSVAISGDVIVAGARGYNANQGAGYVYVKPNGGWSGTLTETAKLTGDVPNPSSDVFLGFSSAIDGDVIALGGTFYDNKGAVLVYQKPTGGWVDTIQSATLLASAGQTLEQFGYSVGIDGDVVVAGAINTVINNNQVGQAYVFEKPTGGWADSVFQSTILRQSSPSGNDLFSWDVSISGDVVVAGAQTHQVGANGNQGAAYVFVKPSGGWDFTSVKNEDATLSIGNSAANQKLGSSVDIHGDIIAVKAIALDTTYIFEKPSGGWSGNLTEDYQLRVNNLNSPAFAGTDVVISDNRIISGFFNQIGSNNEGKIYSYDKPQAGWVDAAETERLRQSLPRNANDSYGSSVAIDGNIAVVGAYSDDELMPEGGKAYVYKYMGNSWQQVAVLQPSQPANSGYFGSEVAISGDVIAVSAWGMGPFGSNSDKATVFVYTKPSGGWVDTITENARLTSSDFGINGFGKSLAMDGDVIVVGAPEANSGATQSGQAYVFSKPNGGWSGDLNEVAVLKPQSPEAYASCGTSVAIQGNLVVVSEPRGNVTGFDEGKVYTYYMPTGGWFGTQTQSGTLIAHDKGNYDYLGYGVSIDDKNILVGCRYDFVTEQWQGSAYVFVEPTGGWVGTINSSAKLIASDGGKSHTLSSRFVKIAGDKVFLSGVEDTINGKAYRGSVYMYNKPSGGWSGTIYEDDRFLAFDGQAEDYFGDGFDIDGYKMVIGASGDSSGNEAYVGGAYFYNFFDIKRVTTSNPNGLYGIGDTIVVTIDMADSVDVTSIPAIELGTGSVKQLATYFSGTGTDEINFRYIVQEDDVTLDLAYTSENAVKLGAGTIKDNGREIFLNLPLPGEDSSLSKHHDLVIDGIRPMPSVTTMETSPTTKDTVEVTITFTEDVDSFDIGDIGTTNTNLIDFIKVDDKTYTVKALPQSGGDFTVFVPFSVAYDSAGNGNKTSNELKLLYNQAGAPTVIITSNDSGRINKSPFEVTLTFSEKVVDFDSMDIKVNNATASNLQTSDSIIFTADITPTIEGVVEVWVDSAATQDLTANDNYASDTFSLYFDPSKPGVTITTGVGTMTNNASFGVTINFTEWVSGFELADITNTNANLSNLQTSDSVVFTADVVPTMEGILTLSIKDSVVVDSATNFNTASNIISIEYDSTRPTCLITSAAPDTIYNPFSATITFSEPVVGFGFSDVNITNGTINSINTTDDSVFTLNINPQNTGYITVQVPDVIVADEAGNHNIASDTFKIYYDDKSSINNVQLAQQTKVYPNPANDNITIKANWATKGFKITVTDLQGRAVLTKEVLENETKLDVSELKQGVYFLYIQGETGVVIKKISVI